MAHSDKIVLKLLKELSGESRTIRISQNQIVKITAIPLPTVQRAIRRLEAAGKISRHYAPGRGHGNVYTLL
jgi:DNA-binding Lrp family transcriptional regulator